MRKTFIKLSVIPMIILAMLVSSCGLAGRTKTMYRYEFIGSFDTLFQIVGFAESEDDFKEMADLAQARFEELHKLFDRFNNYAGIANLHTINENAGVAPVRVDSDLFNLIRFSKDWYLKTPGKLNIAMGPMLELWHKARTEGLNDVENAALPDMNSLKDAARLGNMSDIVLNESESTVFLRNKGMSLDLGAVAKGFACGIVADQLKDLGYTSFIISGGGNIVTAGVPRDGNRTKWGIGIQDPAANPILPESEPFDVAFVTDVAVVTSGDYQRTYMVDNVKYHHLIDPLTLMPATHFRSVTVLGEDSGVADFVSTTLFLMPLAEGKLLAGEVGVEALWILPDGSYEATDGMLAVLRDRGGATNR